VFVHLELGGRGMDKHSGGGDVLYIELDWQVGEDYTGAVLLT
jgi:hypothetical protein